MMLTHNLANGLAVLALLYFSTFSFGQLHSVEEIRSVKSVSTTAVSYQPPILFDFYWAQYLHRYYDAHHQADDERMASEMAKWKNDDCKFNHASQQEREELIRLVSLDEKSLQDSVNELLNVEYLSWDLLIAIEQLHNRRGRQSQAMAKRIEELLEKRCIKLLDGYSSGILSKAQVCGLIHQASSRLTDYRQASNITRQAIETVCAKQHLADISVLSLHSNRLVALATKEDPIFLDEAIASCTTLCEAIDKSEDFKNEYPLALANSRYVLSTLQDSNGQQLAELRNALSAIESAIFNSAMFATEADSRRTLSAVRWSWESRGLLRYNHTDSEISPEQKLFELRREKLLSSILLDGYKLLRDGDPVRDGALNSSRFTKFNAVALSESLQRLELMQADFKIDNKEKLATICSLAVVLQDLKDPSHEIVLDRAMDFTELLTADDLAGPEMMEMLLKIQIGWLESQVRRVRASSNDSTRFERTIQLVSGNPILKETPSVESRLRKINIFYRLQRAELDIVKNLIDELDDANLLEPGHRHLLPSLRLILATRVGDFKRALELESELNRNLEGSDVIEKLVPLYALSELEIELNFRSIEPILDLHEALEQVKSHAHSLPEAFLTHLKLENALQVASAYAYLSRSGADEGLSFGELDGLVIKLSNDFGLMCEEKHYWHLLKHLSESRTFRSTQTSSRAMVAFASDQLATVKKKLATRQEELHILSKKDYQDEFENLKRKEREEQQIIKSMDKLSRDSAKINYNPFNLIAFDAKRSDHEGNRDKLKELQDDRDKIRILVLEKYDQIFRFSREVSLASDNATALSRCVQPLLALANDSRSAAPKNVKYNASCLLIEIAILLGPDNAGCPAEQLDLIVDSAGQTAMEIRKNWSGWHRPVEGTSDDVVSAARDQIFDKYQLGFDLAVRWSVRRGDFNRALEFASLTTNRNFVELGGGFTDSNQALGPQHLQSAISVPSSLIAYYCGNESLHVFWKIDDGMVEHAESFVNRTTLNNAVKALHAKYSMPKTPYQLEAGLIAGWLLPSKLCKALLERPASKSGGCVYVAPHGPLFQIPLEGLPVIGSSKKESLGDLQPLIYLPTLIAVRREGPAEKVQRPGFPSYLTIQPFPSFGQESGFLSQTLGHENTTRIGPGDCTVDKVMRSLKEKYWEIVHFGSHAVGDREEGTSGAYIELNGGKLGIRELRESKLLAKHVFLCACETQFVDSKDLQSGGNTTKALGTSFLAIGAQDVIASHWMVDTGSTDLQFRELFEKYKLCREAGVVSTEVLATILFESRRIVKQSKSYSHPFYWNAFTIWAAR